MLLKTSYKSKPPVSARIVPGRLPSFGCRGCWLLNRNVFDSSLYKNNGIIVGSPTWVAGKKNLALKFANGAADYVKLGTWSTNGKETFVARVKFNEAVGANEQICCADSSLDGLRAFQFRRSDLGKLQFIVFVSDVVKIIAGSSTITTGKWWDVAGVNDGAYLHLYVNAVPDATPVASGDMDNDAASFAMAVTASKVDYSSVSTDLNGEIEFLMRFPGALPVSVIQKIYRDPFYMFERRQRMA